MSFKLISERAEAESGTKSENKAKNTLTDGKNWRNLKRVTHVKNDKHQEGGNDMRNINLNVTVTAYARVKGVSMHGITSGCDF